MIERENLLGNIFENLKNNSFKRTAMEQFSRYPEVDILRRYIKKNNNALKENIIRIIRDNDNEDILFFLIKGIRHVINDDLKIALLDILRKDVSIKLKFAIIFELFNSSLLDDYEQKAIYDLIINNQQEFIDICDNYYNVKDDSITLKYFIDICSKRINQYPQNKGLYYLYTRLKIKNILGLDDKLLINLE